MNDSARSEEIEQLKARLGQYEAAFASAAPRLAAFKQLEELAKSKGSTPEAVAIDASMSVLRDQEAELEHSIEKLNTDREVAREELSATLRHKKEVGDEMTLIQNEHDTLAYEVSELISEIESIRVDAIRLMKERSALQLEVEALRNERAAVDLDAPTIERRAPIVEDVEVVPAPVKTEVTDLDGFEDDDAFSRFIEVDRGPDKARDWFVG